MNTIQQRIYIERKNDRLHGRHIMDYQQFCEAVDKIVPADIINDKGLSIREVNKALAILIHDETGKSYYDIYLGIKYNTAI